MDTNKKKKRWFRWYFCGRKNALRSFFINYDLKTNLDNEEFRSISNRMKKMENISYPEDYISNGWNDLINNKGLFHILVNSDNCEFNILSGVLNAKNKMRQLEAFLEEFRNMLKKMKSRNFFIVLPNRMGEDLFEKFSKRPKYPEETIHLQDKNLEVPVIFGVIMKEIVKRKPYDRNRIIKKYIDSLAEDQKERLLQIETLAKSLMNKYDVGHFKFEFYKGSGRTFGLCCHQDNKIKLSIKHCLEDNDADILDTILHEIAHAIVGIGNGHNRVWKEKAISLGASPYATRKQWGPSAPTVKPTNIDGTANAGE